MAQRCLAGVLPYKSLEKGRQTFEHLLGVLSKSIQTIYSVPTGEKHEAGFIWALQRVFYSMQTSKEAVSTKELTDALGWGPADLAPQDVQRWQSTFHEELATRTEMLPIRHILERLLVGQTMSCVSFSPQEKRSWRLENFWEMPLNVRNLRSLDESLQDYIQPWYLEPENDSINTVVMFDKFPPILNLHLKRFAYDPAVDDFKKVDDFFEFPEEIDLGPFVESSDPASKSESWIYRLVSVVIHEGSYEGGVYYVYVRPEKDGGFFKIHDEQVTPVPLPEVFEAGYGSVEGGNGEGWSKTATLLCYCRMSRLDDIFVDIADSDIPTSVHD
jgi:ubiquitin carboxyl-terminal hydrolase 7